MVSPPCGRVAGRVLLGSVVVLAVGAVTSVALGATTWSSWANYSGAPVPDSWLMVVPVVSYVLVVNGFGEETGWRGFLVDHLLQRRGPAQVALLVGLTWAVWHLPLFFLVDGLRGLGPGTVGWLLGLGCGSIFLTWLYVVSGRSIATVAVWHTLFNLATATSGAAGLVPAVASILVMVAAVVLLVRPASWASPTPRALGPTPTGSGTLPAADVLAEAQGHSHSRTEEP